MHRLQTDEKAGKVDEIMTKKEVYEAYLFVGDVADAYKEANDCHLYEYCDECPYEESCDVLRRIDDILVTLLVEYEKGNIKDEQK